jgi:hypothetical protein
LCTTFQYTGEQCKTLQNSKETFLSDFYNQVLFRILLAALLGWFVYRIFWSAVNRVGRLLVVVQWSLVLAAMMTLPVAYGKLILPAVYRRVTKAELNKEQAFVLIGQTSDEWILWNVQEHQTHLLPKNKNDGIVIGEQIDLLK